MRALVNIRVGLGRLAEKSENIEGNLDVSDNDVNICGRAGMISAIANYSIQMPWHDQVRKDEYDNLLFIIREARRLAGQVISYCSGQFAEENSPLIRNRDKLETNLSALRIFSLTETKKLQKTINQAIE